MSRFEGRRVAALLAALALLVMAMVAANASAQMTINEWEVPSGDANLSNIAVDPSGPVLWFTETAKNRIARVTQNGVIEEYEVPTSASEPWGIAVGSDGRVWFTEYAANKIGNKIPGRSIGEDTIPTDDSRPRGIALDSQGNVWFAESRTDKIGRMTEHGDFDEWDVPSDDSEPWGIAVDDDDNIWFTEHDANKIGRLSRDRSFSEFAIPTDDSGPRGIAVDDQGNVWFAEHAAGKIGRMTPSGQFTEYEIPTDNSEPQAVAVDEFGGAWYAGSGSNSFGRVYNGQITEYGLPTANSRPHGVAVDSDGNIWLVEQVANQIARASGVVTSQPTATPTPAGPTPTPQPTPPPVPHDERYFNETGFRIDNNVFWDYFNKRGGIGTFGYPVSRTFTLLGFSTQFFQRGIMQIGPDGAARTMNILDSGLMPYTRINGSTFPSPDSAVQSAAPAPGTPDYDVRIQQFVANYAPNQWQGMNVNFYQAFVNTVELQDAFPQGGGNPGLLPLLNLEMWGVPTSYPQRDPNNHNFVYLRFQRGIMHYDASNGFTQALLLADYLKSIMTGQNLPSDLRDQAQGSRFYNQYNPNKPNWVDRPGDLPATNLFYAFERQ